MCVCVCPPAEFKIVVGKTKEGSGKVKTKAGSCPRDSCCTTLYEMLTDSCKPWTCMDESQVSQPGGVLEYFPGKTATVSCQASCALPMLWFESWSTQRHNCYWQCNTPWPCFMDKKERIREGPDNWTYCDLSPGPWDTIQYQHREQLLLCGKHKLVFFLEPLVSSMTFLETNF